MAGKGWGLKDKFDFSKNPGESKSPKPLGSTAHVIPYAGPFKLTEYQNGGIKYKPFIPEIGYREKGIASWYGDGFHGKETASGQKYDMYSMTAAHKTLPMGTVVNVKNLDNDKVVSVMITDRGPFIDGRIIDLSYSAGQKIGIDKTGTAKIQLQVIGLPSGLSKDYKTNVASLDGTGINNFFCSCKYCKNESQVINPMLKSFLKATLPEYNLEIASGYRSVGHELAQGRSGNSAHTKGLAVDLTGDKDIIDVFVEQEVIGGSPVRFGRKSDTLVHVDFFRDPNMDLSLINKGYTAEFSYVPGVRGYVYHA